MGHRFCPWRCVAATRAAPVATAGGGRRGRARAARPVGVFRRPIQRTCRKFAARDGLFYQAFDGRQVLLIRGYRDGKGFAQTSSPAGTADAVHVIFGVRGHIKVEDMADGGNVQAARGHVRRYQQAQRSVAKFIQRFGAHRLVKIAVNGGGMKAVRLQRLGHNIHIHLAVAKHDGIGQAFALGRDQGAQDGALFCKAAVFARGGKSKQLLLDRGVCGGLARHFHLGGVVEEGVGDPLNLGGHGGREEQGLAGFGRHLEDAFDVGDKAHVQHPVSFINDHDLHAGQQQFAAFEMV